MWITISVLFFVAALMNAFVLCKLSYRRNRILTPNKMLILGTFLSATTLFCPIYLEKFSDSVGWVEWGKSLLLSMQHAIRLFAFEGDFMDFFDQETITNMTPKMQMIYTGASAVLYTFAPLLTFSLILSFFKNVAAYRRYLFSFWKHAHVFSELNEKTLALAKSIDNASNKFEKGETKRYKMVRKALFVFTDVMNKKDENSLEILEDAKEIGAILFSKDLESIKYRTRLFSIRKLNFYLLSDNEEEKIRHAEHIMKDYDLKNVELRVFSSDIRSELLLAAKDVQQMKVIRVNDIQSLVYHNLDEHGLRLFENARSVYGTEKVISAVIVGLEKYGLEMLKALTWFCQVPGYRIKINAFDCDEQAKEKFVSMCPELMSREHNEQNSQDEARYDINIHGGMDTNHPAFFDTLAQIKDITYIFVSLGSDVVNLSTAVKIRTLCERIRFAGDHKPDIETIIYDTNIRNRMGVKWSTTANEPNPMGVLNFKNQRFDIHMIGDLENFYSVNTLIDSELIEEGKRVHLRYGPESTYWKYEYNYRSSIAKAMHERLRKKLNLSIPGIEKEWNERTDEERLAIGLLEHVRWNAYMRTEGYCFSGSKREETKNDLGKVHNNLVPVTELSNNDLKKDA